MLTADLVRAARKGKISVAQGVIAVDLRGPTGNGVAQQGFACPLVDGYFQSVSGFKNPKSVLGRGFHRTVAVDRCDGFDLQFVASQCQKKSRSIVNTRIGVDDNPLHLAFTELEQEASPASTAGPGTHY